VETIEHLLASLTAFGVDNVVCEIDGPEIPGMDGSSRPFAQAVAEAGTKDQKERVEPHAVPDAVHVNADGWAIVALPRDEGLRLTYTLEFDAPRTVHQTFTFDLDADGFLAEIAPARTFVTADEIEELKKAGLGQGATPDNTLVIGPDAEADAEELRFPDEYVRHKALDLVGDLALLGARLEGAIEVERGGHSLHQRLVREIVTQPGAAEWLGVAARLPRPAESLAAAAR